MRQGSNAACHGYALLTVILWSSAYVFTKVALHHFTSPALGFLRCAVASLVLLVFVVAQRLPLPRLAHIPVFIFSGAMGFGLYMLVFNKGSETLSATTSCVLIATSPIISALLARFLFKERIGGMGWVAIALSFCGILLMTLWDGTLTMSWGMVWMLSAALCIGAYNVVQRWLSAYYSALQITAYSFFFGTLLLVWYVPQALAEFAASPVNYRLLIVFLGVFPSAIAYLLWTRALASTTKISTVTNYMFLTPFLALVLEYTIIAQVPGTGTFLGGGVILASLALFARVGKKS